MTTATILSPETATVVIPLSEFGKSLADTDLDEWFEAFAQRNSDAGQYEISGSGDLLIMPPTGDPGSFFENEIATDLTVWSRSHGGFVRGPTATFHSARRLSIRAGCQLGIRRTTGEVLLGSAKCSLRPTVAGN